MKNKYNIGNEVYFMKDNKVEANTIEAVAWFESKFIYSVDRLQTNHTSFYLNESDLFPSKEELLKSL